jgi:hypothetical protein
VVPELEKIRSMVSPQNTLLLMQFQPRTDGFSRFVYDQAKDDFVGRDHVVERLTRGFLSPRKDDPHKFQWHLVVGAAGVGKSRLGFQLTADAGSAWPISGFIEPSMIQDANWLGWMPEHPAFLVVDNVLRDSTGVKKLLDGLTVADSHSRLAHPVRLLLLERLANVELVESLFEHCPNSRAVLARRFEKEPITLEPLEKDAYLQIARGRDPEKKLDRFNDDALERSLKEIDPECRPLFAALLGEDLSSAPDDDIHVSLSSESTRERRRELLERVIGRDRKFWENLARASYQDSKKAENLLESHERLLALATITRGFSRSRLEPAAFGPSLYLPGDREFDKALYARMSDQVITADADFLSPLEPDLIGELFVLNLIKDNKRVQRALIDLAWKLDPVGSSFFAGMAEVDYGTADTPPLRLLPAPSQVTAEMAPSVTHALRAVSRALSYRTIDAHPETHPPWTFPDFDELETKKFLREQFNQSRQTVPPSDGPLPRG